MHLAVVGLNHKTAPVEIRERVAVPRGELAGRLLEITSNTLVQECVLVSTCNRTEAYAVVGDTGEEALAGFLTSFSGLPGAQIADHLFTHTDESAVQHLFRVASGVDSMILGEPQVLGQVREAYEQASLTGTTGPITSRMFECALATGKRVRTETGINCGAFSVGSAAVELARSIFGDLSGRSVLLIGAGETAELVAERLVQSGASFSVINRTIEKAEDLAGRFGGIAADYDRLTAVLALSDIVIASTSAPHFILGRETLEGIMRWRRMGPMFLIDLGVPRNIDPAISGLESAYLYDIDDLCDVVQETARDRTTEVRRAEQLIEQEVQDFLRWRSTLAAVPVIRGLKGRLHRLATAELDRFSGRLSHLSEPDRQIVGQLVRSLVNKISHHPITHIKDYASSEGVERLKTVVEVFGIDHEPAESEPDWRGDGI